MLIILYKFIIGEIKNNYVANDDTTEALTSELEKKPSETSSTPAQISPQWQIMVRSKHFSKLEPSTENLN